ncbi:MAG: triose-phosphate isomerase [Desulfobulbaceae bacterium]|uniref:Triosephosphate isomerase n=1 Tax=Candidatus Desulfatifera sulfidica TaxID=2841691 RepID=A0A8J6N8U3_9BACT|nr:triose-phosphate isomerase [Candidatus Desulfatifera sulfidica]
MSRRPLLVGNWKMHTTVVEACQLAAAIRQGCADLPEERDIMLAPPATVLSEVSHIVHGSGIILAGQNVCWGPQGAFTGEISAVMIQGAGGNAALVGHSERRQIFHEDDAMVNRRLRGGLDQGLLMILCVGETLEEREGGQTLSVLEEQLRAGLSGVSIAQCDRLAIAYEPVWAIGTGLTASGEQAQEVHSFLRDQVTLLYEKNVADQMRILYGGSVKPDNIDQLMAQPDIDGALVGGAALDAASFIRIMQFKA